MAMEYTYEEVMALKEGEFDALVEEMNALDWYENALNRKEARETYPRKKVLDEQGNPIKKINKSGKEYTVTEADYSRKPTIKNVPISFFTLKKAFCEEVLGLEKKEVVKPETFRERGKKFVEERKAAKAAAAK